MANDNTLPILAHVLGLVVGFLGPLIILLVSDTDENAKKHSKLALNWQISLIIYFIVSGILALVFIGFILMIALAILNLIFCIKAAIKASNGELYKYPLTIQFLKV